MAGILRAGDVEILELIILSSNNGNAINVIPQMVSVEIFEEISKPFITGRVILRDSQDLINSVPIIGRERLFLRVRTPSSKEEYRGEFLIYKMDDRVDVHDRDVLYTLHFMSIEAVVDISSRHSRLLSGRISDLIELVVKDKDLIGSSKRCNIESTANSISFVSNWWSPVKCIMYMADNAVNIRGSASYLFFENKYGFNFVSMDSLNSQTAMYTFKGDKHSDRSGDNPMGGSRKDLSNDYSQILSWRLVKNFDYIERITSGMAGSESVSYDILSKVMYHSGYPAPFEGYNHLNDYPLINESTFSNSRAVMMRYTYAYNNIDGASASYTDGADVDRRHRMSEADGFKVEIEVFGKTEYSVGQKIYLDMPTPSEISKTGNDVDFVHSGNYIIGSINHFISTSSHKCIMELIKDSHIIQG